MLTNYCQAFKGHLSKKLNSMESISELALKGHFEQLKSEANKKSLEDRPLDMLKHALAYLEKINNKGMLDDEGKRLIGTLKGHFLAESGLMQPKPMTRAKGTQEVEKLRKKAI